MTRIIRPPELPGWSDDVEPWKDGELDAEYRTHPEHGQRLTLRLRRGGILNPVCIPLPVNVLKGLLAQILLAEAGGAVEAKATKGGIA